MPNIQTTLSEIAQSVSRPIIADVVMDLNRYLKTDPNTKLIFPGDTETTALSGDNIDDNLKDREATFASIKHLVIESTEEDVVEDIGITSVKRREQLPVFMDTELGVYITPVYINTEVKIEYKFNTPNKSEAIRWRNDMRMYVSAGRDTILHKLNYHYLIPEVFLDVLKAIHKNKLALTGCPCDFNQTFHDYLLKHITNRLTVKADLTNKNNRYAINERQARIQGIFNFTDVSNVTRENNTGYSVSLTYKFNYMKPIGCTMRYPIIVYNQLLPAEYIDFNDTSTNLFTTPSQYNIVDYAYSQFESDNIMDRARRPDLPVRIPYFEDFVPKTLLPGTGTVMLITTIVDKDKRTLLNIGDLGDYTLDDDFMRFIIESELPYVTRFSKSIINFSLYAGYTLQPNGLLKLTKDLDLITIRDLDLTKPHRVRLSLVVDLTLLDPDALKRLGKYPEVLKKYIAAAYDSFSENQELNNLLNKKHLSDLELSMLFKGLTGQDWPYFNTSETLFKNLSSSELSYMRNKTISRKTVMISGILALRDTQRKDINVWKDYGVREVEFD